MIGPLSITISSSAPVEELDRSFESGKISYCTVFVLGNINSFFAGGRKSSSDKSLQLNFSLWNGMCNSGVFVTKGFRCSARDNF